MTPELHLLFAPEEGTDGRFELSVTSAAVSLSVGNHVAGMARPDLDALDRHMGAAKTGYQLRVLPDGSLEISARDSGATALASWLTHELAGRG